MSSFMKTDETVMNKHLFSFGSALIELISKRLFPFRIALSLTLEAKYFLRKIKNDLVMARHIQIIPPLEKAKKQEMPSTRLSASVPEKCRI